MYQSIYVALDNSELSTRGIDLGITFAQAFGGRLVGSHVYAAALHDQRFRQMEGGLPEQFKEEKELIRQREVHDSLITRGLELITDSYLDIFRSRCKTAGVTHECRSLEGKNHHRLVEDIAELRPDLAIIGALGLGKVPDSVIGGVCERVVRHSVVDTWVVKGDRDPHSGNCAPRIAVAIDGSPRSFGGLIAALDLGRRLGLDVEAIAAFDPYFHTVAFRSIAKVLSEEAGKVFRFKEQEKLHEEIIDSGLARIYQAHLDVAAKIAEEMGTSIRVKLLAGKAFAEILRYVREERPWALVLGRSGIHQDHEGVGAEIGGTAENLVRSAPCHVLVAAQTFTPPADDLAEETMSWTTEAEARMDHVPTFVRGMVRKAVLRYAVETDHTVITSDLLDQAMHDLMPEGHGRPAGPGPAAAMRAGDGTGHSLRWTEKAKARLHQVPEGMMRTRMRERVLVMAQARKATSIDIALVEEAVAQGREEMRQVMDGENRPTPAVECPQPQSPPAVLALPEGFVQWQLDVRRGVFDRIRQRDPIAFVAAHLPMMSTLNANGEFPIHASTKGVGFFPVPEQLDAYLRAIEDCLEHVQGRPVDETAEERVAVARDFYTHREHIDWRAFGLLEIFKGQTWRNLAADQRVTLLFTGTGPTYTSYQVNCTAEIVGPEDPRFQFLHGMRQLFEYERFHLHQPNYTAGYILHVQEVFDKTPVMGRAGKKVRTGARA